MNRTPDAQSEYTTKSSPWPAGETVKRLLAVPLAALDLPLKVLVWAEDGGTRVSYLTPAALAARYGLPASLAAPLAGIDQLVDSVLADDGGEARG
jgi:uncharacterized protein (DUF302 family)